MQKNFDTVLKALDDTDLMDGGKPITLAMIAANALLNDQPAHNTSGPEKAKRYELALRLYKGGEHEVSAEEISLIKKTVGESYPPLLVGQVYKHLEK